MDSESTWDRGYALDRHTAGGAATPFAFGENWARYSGLLDERRVQRATADLAGLVGDLSGKSFLDLGCGSGVHSLAATRLGATRVIALDSDSTSAATARRVLAGTHAKVLTADMLAMPDVGAFDVVYSWGALHHTGAMWKAIHSACSLVKPGGTFAFAIYHRTPMCAAWRAEKLLYSRAPKGVQAIIRSLYVSALALRMGRSFRRHVGTYADRRGMDFWHDVHDWLGGYPYESAVPDEIDALMTALGFRRERLLAAPPGFGIFGAGCDEYVYRRGR